MPRVAAPRPPPSPRASTSRTPGEAWIAFLRGYAPANRNDGMYAETIARHARKFDCEPIRFDHPAWADLEGVLAPAEGRLTNVMLTGTAGDGKTTLCQELWDQFVRDGARPSGRHGENHRVLTVSTPDGDRRLHFVFEFNGLSPERGQPWSEASLELMRGFVRSVRSPAPDEFFVVAANDGRLVQAWEGLGEHGEALDLSSEIEELLASDRKGLDGLSLLFLNLSRFPSAALLRSALDALVARPEWRCLVDEADDPAFGPGSPLARNFGLLRDPAFADRLVAVAEVLDANGVHVPIREVLMLLVNGILGSPEAPEFLSDAAHLRSLVADGQAHRACLHDNLFGANLPERRRIRLSVFRYLCGLRIGQETTSVFDNLIVYGADDPKLLADHLAYVGDDAVHMRDPDFEGLRRDYVEAEDARGDKAEAFLAALVGERRRLFFRLPEAEGRLDPWGLSLYGSAGGYRRRVLAPLREGRPVDVGVVKRLVCGLNRVWTGMLVGELDRLYLTTGLDLTSAPVSEVYVYRIPLYKVLHGDRVEVARDDDGGPVLRVRLGSTGPGVSFALRLSRFEFLARVAQGALPASLSKECFEDVMAFKTRVLVEYQAILGGASAPLALLRQGARQSVEEVTLEIEW